ncbi:DUF6602 domain-containing protein [Streptomyces sp. NPDC006906]|uniref:DUF6602 domain-containing protein n=1 Tax=Streptomyces sp. NPDC006906 TaxID=3154782 RepID=UPI0033F96605
MTDNRLEQILHSVAKRMRTEFELSGGFTHSGEKGTTRERVLHNFLEDYLPGHARAFHNAEIISVDGQTSAQCDVVICDRSTPPLLDMKSYRTVPNECVYGLIEVKSKLNKSELLDACEKIRRAKSLPKSAYEQEPLKRHRTVHGKRYDYYPTMGMIFAFDSIKLPTLLKHFAEWCSTCDAPEQRPDSIWVLGKGYFTWMTPEESPLLSPEPKANFHSVEPPPDRDILLPFAIYLNAYFSSAWMPPFKLLDYAANVRFGISRNCLTEPQESAGNDPPADRDTPDTPHG